MKKIKNTTPAEHLKDEEVLASIIAGGMAARRRVLPSLTFRSLSKTPLNHGFGVCNAARGPVCAVGAGVLFAGIDRTNRPVRDFTLAHSVSTYYALGVSDGFEQSLTRGVLTYGIADYTRGVAVGEAAFDYFGVDGRGRKPAGDLP